MSLLVVDKPVGLSSFGVVKRVRALLGKKREKVGHGGTLDPFASGVLPICVGEGTKVLAFLLDLDKTYETVVRFGVETDTLDVTGQVVAQHPVLGLTESSVAAALERFRGTIEQVPPMYSALKRDGQPLYKYARAGITLERTARQVTIHALDLLGFEAPDRARLRIRCSKGTYIRSLAADLGTHLGVGAHLVELRRTASGPFRIEHALSLDELASRVADSRPLPMLSPLQALAHLPSVTVDEVAARVLACGQRMDWTAFTGGRALTGPVCAICYRSSSGSSSRSSGPAGDGPVAAEPVLIAVVGPNTDGTVKILRGFAQNPPEPAPSVL